MVSLLPHSRPLRAALGLAALAATPLAFTATNAAFTDGVSVSTEISTGTVALQAVGDDLVFTSSPLAPGDAATALVRLRNTGLPAELALHREDGASTAPHGCAIRTALHLTVVEDLDGDAGSTGDRRVVVDADLATAPAQATVGRLASDEARSFAFTVRFVPQGGTTAADNDNCLASSTERQRFRWTVVEARP